MFYAAETACLLAGRFLLGLYFIVPGVSKIVGFEATTTYMAEHNVPLIIPLLVLTIVIQIAGGLALIVGWHGRYAAFLLAGLTLMINLYMHDFWDMAEGQKRAHETQNFIKNLAIMAGLLAVAGLGTGRLSLTPSSGARPPATAAESTSLPSRE